MGGLSGTALMNIGKDSKIDTSTIAAAYYLFHSTSPTTLLVAHVESCVVPN
jgi:arginine/lysine/ornithine decarboxylase